MQAFVIHRKHTTGIEDHPRPEPEPGEALVKVRACGICGSDLHAYEGTQPFFRYPEVPGHEVVGELVALRPRPGGPLRLPNRPVSEDLAVGERVVLDPALPCGTCYPCTRGRYNCCENMRVIGVHAPGALAEFYVAPLECLHRVPADVSDELAALAEPLSIGVQATRRARITDTDSVLVIGAGTIGLCVMLVARARGARVALSEPSAARRARALQLGAGATFDPTADGFEQQLTAWCGDSGPAVVVEAVGTPRTAAQALELVVAAGRVLLLGLISAPLALPGNLMVKKELDFLGSRLHGGTIPEALRLIAQRQVDVAGLVTDRVPLAGARDALERMLHAPDEVLKAVVYLSGPASA